MKILFSVLILAVSTVLFSSCLSKTTVKTSPSVEQELSQPIPTTGVVTTDQKDQQVIDELDQYQDKSFDSDFQEMESQF